MNFEIWLVDALISGLIAVTANAQSGSTSGQGGTAMPGMGMSEMNMPMPQKKKPAHKRHKAVTPAAGMQAMPGMDMPMPAGNNTSPDENKAAPAAHDISAMPGMEMLQQMGTAPHTVPANSTARDMKGMSEMSGIDMSASTGLLGSYPMTRDASGTSWQPDFAEHHGLHAMLGDWMLMGHARLVGFYDTQSGPRGGHGTYLAGMLMGAARRDFGVDDTLNLRLMLSPDPFIGKSGYPLLLQTGETANGRTALVDRQHPHDLMMELAGSYAHRLSDNDSVFLYVGYPGEPALGPPAFMHRASGMDIPDAPISHHWLDSTHVTFGVVTAGVVQSDWKLEVSQFTGREPDQFRFDFDPAKFDSTSARLS